ncbi:PREDICTED: RRP12-like protein [Rhagoletis zephyria]|uniref:RRP12-like protein n=1 Tax=Rhagoletis zephyria TaxID=28612 RepID=UPI0008115786|nr:PREDICTED: RRP12-like protein [Rhagoletis zephyria]XP_036336522.1 RRP12-like protein [Rhagoletis pomonella]
MQISFISDHKFTSEELIKIVKSTTIDDILADYDSDLPEDMDADNGKHNKADKRKPKRNSTFIRKDPEDIVDLADIKSIGNVLSS